MSKITHLVLDSRDIDISNINHLYEFEEVMHYFCTWIDHYYRLSIDNGINNVWICMIKEKPFGNGNNFKDTLKYIIDGGKKQCNTKKMKLLKYYDKVKEQFISIEDNEDTFYSWIMYRILNIVEILEKIKDSKNILRYRYYILKDIKFVIQIQDTTYQVCFTIYMDHPDGKINYEISMMKPYVKKYINEKLSYESIVGVVKNICDYIVNTMMNNCQTMQNNYTAMEQYCKEFLQNDEFTKPIEFYRKNTERYDNIDDFEIYHIQMKPDLRSGVYKTNIERTVMNLLKRDVNQLRITNTLQMNNELTYAGKWNISFKYHGKLYVCDTTWSLYVKPPKCTESEWDFVTILHSVTMVNEDGLLEKGN